MKKTALLFIAFVLSLAHVSAQSPEYPLSVSANVGASIAGTVVKRVYKLLDKAKLVEADLDPAWQISADYSINKLFSVGAAFSQQKLDLTVKGYVFNEGKNTEDFKATVTRTNYGIRGLVHYGNFPRADIYSGLRLGMTQWTASTTSLDPDNKLKKSLTLFAPQLILLGARGYFTKNLGANIEFAVGSPHYVSVGLSCRIGSWKSDNNN